MVLSWKDLGTSFYVNAAVLLAVLVSFNGLRRMPWLSDFYAAKTRLRLPFRCGPPRYLDSTW